MASFGSRRPLLWFPLGRRLCPGPPAKMSVSGMKKQLHKASQVSGTKRDGPGYNGTMFCIKSSRGGGANMWVNILLSSAAQSARQGPHHIHHISIYRLHGASISTSTISIVKNVICVSVWKFWENNSMISHVWPESTVVYSAVQMILSHYYNHKHLTLEGRPSITQQNVFIYIY